MTSAHQQSLFDIQGSNLHFLCDHKSRVETKNKMTNDLAFVLQVLKFLNELFSRGKCDLVDVTTDFIGTHANAVIFDRYGLFALVQKYVNMEVISILQTFHKTDELYLVNRVNSI